MLSRQNSNSTQETSSPASNMMPMPSPEEVEKAYNQVLEEQLVSPNVRESLSRKLTTEKKWATVINFRNMMQTADTALSFGENDKALLNSLKEPKKRPDIPQLLQLKTRISTSNKYWMETFIANNGIEILLTAMDKRLVEVPMGELDAAILFELISCAKPIMNNGITLKKFLSTPGAIRIMCQCLVFEWKPLATTVLEVLSVICDYSNEGTKEVVKWLRSQSKMRHEPPFTALVDAMVDEDVEVKAAIIQLVNNILAGMPELSDRMSIRNELKSLRFGKICEIAIENLQEELKTIQDGGNRNNALQMRNSLKVKLPDLASTILKDEHQQTADRKQRRRSQMVEKYPSMKKLGDDLSEIIYAEDGKTPIDPQHGIMAGICSTGKNRFTVASNILKEFGGKSTKTRWFVLDKDSFSWWPQDAKNGPPSGSIENSDIYKINNFSTNEDLNTLFTFEIVTAQRVHSFCCASEELRENWIIALNVARDKAQLKKCSYNLLSTTLDSSEFQIQASMLSKQVKVFEAIAAEDHDRAVTKSGINLTDYVDLSRYISLELTAVGRSDQFLQLLQELIVVDCDTEFGEAYWENLISSCREMRKLKKRSDDENDITISKYKLDVESCMKVLKRKEKTPAGKAALELNKLTLSLFTKQEEIDRLQKEIARLQGDAGRQKLNVTKYNTFGAMPTSSIKFDSNHNGAPPPPPKPTTRPPPRPQSREVRVDSVNTAPPSITQNEVKAVDEVNTLVESKVEVDANPKTNLNALLSSRLPPPTPPPSTLPPPINNNPATEEVPANPKAALNALFAKRAPPVDCQPSDEPPPNPKAALNALFANKLPPPGPKPSSSDNNSEGKPKIDLAAALNKKFNNGSAANNEQKSEKTPSKPAAGASAIIENAAVKSSSRPIPQPPPLPPGAEKYLGAVAQAQATPGLKLPPPKAVVKEETFQLPAGIAPSKKMKGVFWNKLRPADCKKSALWETAKQLALKSQQIDFSSLEDRFSQAEEAAVVVAPQSASSKPKAVSLLDPKRTQNILISLGKLRKPPDELVVLISMLDPQQFTLELCEIVENLVPTAEETSTLNAYPNKETLGKAEQLLIALITIPRLKQRLECHHIVFVWNNMADRVAAQINIVTQACLESSRTDTLESFSQILAVVLLVGNYMNSGSSRMAGGVKLESLLKLNLVKPGSGYKGTLLHFIVKEVKKNFPDALGFCSQWSFTGPAAEVSLSQTEADLKQLQKEFVIVEEELKLASSNNQNSAMASMLIQRLDSFYVSAKERLETLHGAFSKATSLVEATLSNYGETPTIKSEEDSAKQFFTTLNEFATTFKKILEEVDAMEQEELKSASREKAKTPVVTQDDEDATPAPPPEQPEKSAENLFGRFRNAQEASTDAIIDQLKKKMQLRKKTAEA